MWSILGKASLFEKKIQTGYEDPAQLQEELAPQEGLTKAPPLSFEEMTSVWSKQGYVTWPHSQTSDPRGRGYGLWMQGHGDHIA